MSTIFILPPWVLKHRIFPRFFGFITPIVCWLYLVGRSPRKIYIWRVSLWSSALPPPLERQKDWVVCSCFIRLVSDYSMVVRSYVPCNHPEIAQKSPINHHHQITIIFSVEKLLGQSAFCISNTSSDMLVDAHTWMVSANFQNMQGQGKPTNLFISVHI